MSLFEKAARLKLRFDTPKGALSAEDLWDLPLTSSQNRANLNDLAVGLYRKLQDSAPISFVDAAIKTDEVTQLRFDLVKHVIDVRVAENAVRAQEHEKARKRGRIMELIANKEEEQLAGKSTDELRELLAGL